MANLYIPNDYDAPEDDGVLISTGDDIDFDSSREDAVLEVSGASQQLVYRPMGPFGFTLNLEESKKLLAVLSEAVAKAEIANEYTD